MLIYGVVCCLLIHRVVCCQVLDHIEGGGSALIMEYLDLGHREDDRALGEGLARYANKRITRYVFISFYLSQTRLCLWTYC